MSINTGTQPSALSSPYLFPGSAAAAAAAAGATAQSTSSETSIEVISAVPGDGFLVGNSQGNQADVFYVARLNTSPDDLHINTSSTGTISLGSSQASLLIDGATGKVTAAAAVAVGGTLIVSGAATFNQSMQVVGALSAASLSTASSVTAAKIILPNAAGFTGSLTDLTIPAVVGLSTALTVNSLTSSGTVSAPSVSLPNASGFTGNLTDLKVQAATSLATALTVSSLTSSGTITSPTVSLPHASSFTGNITDLTIPSSLTLPSTVTISNGLITTTGTLSGNLSVGGTLTSGALSATSGAVSGNLSVGGTVTSGAVSAPSATLSGALNAFSAVLSGAVTAASATLSGALTAASATVNTLNGASLVLTGALTAASATITTLSGTSATLSGALNAATATLTGALTAASATIPTLTGTSATLSGALNAATATLTGALTAASAAITTLTGTTATFTGSLGCNALSARTASLTGTLSAQAITVATQLSSATAALTGALTAGAATFAGQLNVTAQDTFNRAIQALIPSATQSNILVGSALSNGNCSVLAWTPNLLGLNLYGGPSATLNMSGQFATASAALTGALTAASASFTGALSAASVALTGALTAASAAISGTLTAGSITSSGNISGPVTATTISASGVVTAPVINGAGTTTYTEPFWSATNNGPGTTSQGNYTTNTLTLPSGLVISIYENYGTGGTYQMGSGGTLQFNSAACYNMTCNLASVYNISSWLPLIAQGATVTMTVVGNNSCTGNFSSQGSFNGHSAQVLLNGTSYSDPAANSGAFNNSYNVTSVITSNAANFSFVANLSGGTASLTSISLAVSLQGSLYNKTVTVGSNWAAVNGQLNVTGQDSYQRALQVLTPSATANFAIVGSALSNGNCGVLGWTPNQLALNLYGGPGVTLDMSGNVVVPGGVTCASVAGEWGFNTTYSMAASQSYTPPSSSWSAQTLPGVATVLTMNSNGTVTLPVRGIYAVTLTVRIGTASQGGGENSVGVIWNRAAGGTKDTQTSFASVNGTATSIGVAGAGDTVQPTLYTYAANTWTNGYNQSNYTIDLIQRF